MPAEVFAFTKHQIAPSRQRAEYPIAGRRRRGRRRSVGIAERAGGDSQLPQSRLTSGPAPTDTRGRVTEVIGVSSESWAAAARNAVETAAGSVRDRRGGGAQAGRRDRERTGYRLPGTSGDLVQVRLGRLAADRQPLR